MHGRRARVGSLALGLVVSVSLGCSSSEPEARTKPELEPAELEPDEPETKPELERASFAERAPRVGDPAPPLTLATLDGGRVALPQSNADRAAVLIFGSFS